MTSHRPAGENVDHQHRVEHHLGLREQSGRLGVPGRAKSENRRRPAKGL